MSYIALLVVGCVGGSADDSGAPSTGIGALVDPSGESATVGGTAFGFDSASNGKIALFFPGNEGASCGDVARSLSGDETLDPAAITPSGTCSVFVLADYVAPDETTWSDFPASVVMNCAFGDGSWTQSSDCDAGYCYTGDFWTGGPVTFSVTASGGDEADYPWDLTLADGAGQYPYVSFDPIALTGDVAGSGTASWCPEIGQSVYF